MSEVIFNRNGIISMGSVDGEKDLKPRPGINLNPPPPDGRCECCGRYISELKPYGGPGDPLVGDFTGAYLVKRFRPGAPYDEEAETARKEADKVEILSGVFEGLSTGTPIAMIIYNTNQKSYL